MPIEKQVLIALRRFGSAETVHSHAMWAGVGYGTIDLYTRRIFTAIHSSNLRTAHVQWLVGQEREKAKLWAKSQACPEWRDGWCMVDGTLIPLYCKPCYYGDL